MHRIKLVTAISILFLLLLFTSIQQTRAQALRIVTINTFTGALTGAALGGATIALQNEYDQYPLRFGLGLGTILGLGTGFYDLSRSASDHGYYVNGLISSANTTGTIILLDTFYGAATGAIVGVAVSLMSKDSDIVKGLQYGGGAGAWVGFAFGLVDAFTLSTSGNYDSFYENYTHRNRMPAGLVELRSLNDQYVLGFLNPVVLHTVESKGNGDLSARAHLGVEFTRLNISF